MKYISYLVFLIGFSNLFSSCKKKDAVSLPSFDTYMSGQQSLTRINLLLAKAGIDNFKNGPGPFTWFLPTNTALQAEGITEDSINKMTPGFANYLAMYHLLNRSLVTSEMIAKYSVPRITQGGIALFTGSKDNNKFFVNGFEINQSNNLISNGVVHVINKFHTPPPLKGNLQLTLSSTGQHALFIAALQKANLWTQFSSASIFTVMAPTDDAMTAEGYSSTTVINALSGTALTNLTNWLRYHYFLGRRVFSNDLYDGTSPITGVAGRFLDISSNGTKVKGDANTTSVNITGVNRLATNGVVHTIDGFLKY